MSKREIRSARLQVVLTPSEHEALRRECETLEISMGQYIRRAIAALRREMENDGIY